MGDTVWTNFDVPGLHQFPATNGPQDPATAFAEKNSQEVLPQYIDPRLLYHTKGKDPTAPWCTDEDVNEARAEIEMQRQELGENLTTDLWEPNQYLGKNVGDNLQDAQEVDPEADGEAVLVHFDDENGYAFITLNDQTVVCLSMDEYRELIGTAPEPIPGVPQDQTFDPESMAMHGHGQLNGVSPESMAGTAHDCSIDPGSTIMDGYGPAIPAAPELMTEITQDNSMDPGWMTKNVYGPSNDVVPGPMTDMAQDQAIDLETITMNGYGEFNGTTPGPMNGGSQGETNGAAQGPMNADYFQGQTNGAFQVQTNGPAAAAVAQASNTRIANAATLPHNTPNRDNAGERGPLPRNDNNLRGGANSVEGAMSDELREEIEKRWTSVDSFMAFGF